MSSNDWFSYTDTDKLNNKFKLLGIMHIFTVVKIIPNNVGIVVQNHYSEYYYILYNDFVTEQNIIDGINTYKHYSSNIDLIDPKLRYIPLHGCDPDKKYHVVGIQDIDQLDPVIGYINEFIE